MLPRSCLDCIYLKAVAKHPFNTEPYARGRITDTMGYACTVPLRMSQEFVLFFDLDKELIGCELFEERDNVQATSDPA